MLVFESTVMQSLVSYLCSYDFSF